MTQEDAHRAPDTLLVVGASGVIGAGAVELFARLPDWDVMP